MVLDYWDSETPKVLTIGYVYYKVVQCLYPESIDNLAKIIRCLLFIEHVFNKPFTLSWLHQPPPPSAERLATREGFRSTVRVEAGGRYRQEGWLQLKTECPRSETALQPGRAGVYSHVQNGMLVSRN